MSGHIRIEESLQRQVQHTIRPTMRTRSRRVFPMWVLVLVALLAGLGPVLAVAKIAPNPTVVVLVQDLLNALLIEDDASRLAAVVPLVHKSLLTRDGKTLDEDTRQFSYKKAWQNARFYALPARIVEVHKGRSLTVGYGPTAEKGRIDKYFIAKKPGQPGRPAPISVFIPQSGGAPRIIDMGSL